MRVAPIKTISLISSSVTSSAYDEYDPETPYYTDDTVKVSFESDEVTPRTPVVEYESLADSNTGNYPPTSPTQWSEIGTSNQWKMFDQYINSETTDSNDIDVSIDSNKSNIVGLFNLVGSSVEITLSRNGETIKTETISLKTLPSVSFYSWMFDDYEYKDRVFWDFPKYSDGVLSVSISTVNDEATCGEMVIGSQQFLGKTQYGANVGIEDYSVYSTDSLGRTYLNQGDYADLANIEFWMYNSVLDSVRKKLASVRGVMSLWDMNNSGSDYDSLRIYGFFENFDIIIPGPKISKCSLTIRGTT